MNEIFKGMDNAAEQIDNNFKGIKDYVIEQGENYTKWNSGKLECWGEHTTQNVTLTRTETSGFPGYYTNDIIIDLPIDFVGTAFPVGSLKAQGYRSPFIPAIFLRETKKLVVVITQMPSSWADVIISYHIIGRWK